eukprot:239325-Amphidinium_carterae.1
MAADIDPALSDMCIRDVVYGGHTQQQAYPIDQTLFQLPGSTPFPARAMAATESYDGILDEQSSTIAAHEVRFLRSAPTQRSPQSAHAQSESMHSASRSLDAACMSFDLGVNACRSAHPSKHHDCEFTQHVYHSRSYSYEGRARPADTMGRTKDKDKTVETGRSRSSRHVEEEVARMMREAEAHGSFGERSRSSKQLRRPTEQATQPRARVKEPQPTDERRQRSVPGASGPGGAVEERGRSQGVREVRLREAVKREPLQRRKRNTEEMSVRTHKEDPRRHARRITAEKEPSVEAIPKKMPRGIVATGSNALPLQRAILTPRPRSASPTALREVRRPKPNEELETRTFAGMEDYVTLGAEESPPWLPDYIRGAMVVRQARKGKELACRLCLMNIGGRKAKWYADFDTLWMHFRDVHHKKATQAAMILHLADKWAHLSDTHRESGL